MDTSESTRREAQQLLYTAREHVLAHWEPGDFGYYGPEGPDLGHYCAVGAIAKAARFNPARLFALALISPAAQLAVHQLSVTILAHTTGYVLFASDVHRIVGWNDAPERTRAEVAEMLDLAARSLR